MLKSLIDPFYKAILLFHARRGTTLAAASSFYVIMTIVPLTLLLIRLVGFVIGDLSRGSDEIFVSIERFMPNVSAELFEQIKTMISGPLFGGAKVTVVNLVILFFSSLSFFNSIWNGLYLITNDRSYLSFWKNLKGVVIIGMTIGLFSLSLSLPRILIFSVGLVQNNFVVNFIWDLFPPLRPLLDYLRHYDIGALTFLSSPIVMIFFFVIYFALLYRWFFSWRLPYLNSFIAASTFVLALFAGKNFFWIYFFYVRDNLVKNYGDFYTVIVGLMWVYLVLCFFYFGACLCHVLRDKPIFFYLRLFLRTLRKKNQA